MDELSLGGKLDRSVFEIKSWETRMDFNKLEKKSRTRTVNFNQVRGKLAFLQVMACSRE